MAWVIPMGALTAAVLGMVMGALCQRWGQYGFLVIWLGGIALGTLLGKVAELYATGRTGGVHFSSFHTSLASPAKVLQYAVSRIHR